MSDAPADSGDGLPSAETCRRAIEASPNGIFLIDDSGRILFANQRGHEIFAYAPDALVGQCIELLVPKHSHAQHVRDRQRFMSRPGGATRPMGSGRDLYGVRRDGRQVPVEIGLTPVDSGREPLVLATVTDITERKLAEARQARLMADIERTNKELARTNAQLDFAVQEAKSLAKAAEAASRAKSRFLATMSHELRTPLNAIIGFADIFRQELLGPLGSESYRDYAEEIHHGGQKLLRVLNDVLELSNVASGSLKLQCERVDVAAVLAECESALAGQAEAAGLSCVVRIEPGLSPLQADPERLFRMLEAVIKNSITYTPPPGQITLSAATTEDGGVAISVSDTGIGMKEDDIERALEPFTQLAGPHARAAEGIGLGLTIAQALAELQGARLELASGPGDGTTVTFRFPPQSPGRSVQSPGEAPSAMPCAPAPRRPAGLWTGTA